MSSSVFTLPAVLRVYLSDPPASDVACAWALFDGSGKIAAQGVDPCHRWPPAPRREAIIAAHRVRIAAVALPRLPESKTLAAATFAIEEQLAGPVESMYLAVAKQQANGNVRIAILDALWFKSLAASTRVAGISFDRVLVEPDLAPVKDGEWIWCAQAAHMPGFVRFSNGASINVGPAIPHAKPKPPSESRPLPTELSLALQQTRDRKDRPLAVRVAIPGISTDVLAMWSGSTSLTFEAAPPWQWEDVRTANGDLIDLKLEQSSDRSALSRTTGSQTGKFGAFRPAAFIAGFALLFHLAATLGEWTTLKLRSLQVEGQMNDIAQRVAPDRAGAAPAPAVIAATYSELRRQAGLTAPDDFTSLLARAAPALQTLPPGAVRALSYRDKHILLELKALEPPRLAALQADLGRLLLPSLAVPTPSGPRLRFGIE